MTGIYFYTADKNTEAYLKLHEGYDNNNKKKPEKMTLKTPSTPLGDSAMQCTLWTQF